MENLESCLEKFHKSGYLVVSNMFDLEGLSAYRAAFSNLLKRFCAERGVLDTNAAVSIDQMLLSLYRLSPKKLVDLQRIATRLPEFYRVSSDPRISAMINHLMGLQNFNPLYMISNVAVFEFPNNPDDKSTYNFHTDWHNDVFWTIPESDYMHIWIPLLHDAVASTGSLQVIPGSHLQDHSADTTFFPEKDFNYRYGISSECVSRYGEAISVEVKCGDALFFHKNLIHKSGLNTSADKVRMTMLGMYHDASRDECIPPTAYMKFRRKSPEQWYYELTQDERALPLAKEQLDEQEEAPGGI